MSTLPERERVLDVTNRHVPGAGHPPKLAVAGPLRTSYFENEHEEQFIFQYDSKKGAAFVWGGDLGWETAYPVVRYDNEPRLVHVRGGLVILNGPEQEWLSLCVRTYRCRLPNWFPSREAEPAVDAMLQFTRLNSPYGRRVGGVRVFVSSPKQLRPERLLVVEICQELADEFHTPIVPLLWEGGGVEHPDVPPFPARWNEHGAQAVIDDHLVSDLGVYDIYLGMIWHRMGTPLPPFRSGTEAEYQAALRWKKQFGFPLSILFYQKTAPAQDADPDQQAQVAAFIRELHPRQLVQTFDDLDAWRVTLKHHLQTEIRRILTPEGADPMIPALRRLIASRAYDGANYVRCPECGSADLEQREFPDVDDSDPAHPILIAEVVSVQCRECDWEKDFVVG